MKHLGILAPFAAVVLTVILSGMNSQSFVSFDSAAVAEAQPEEPVAESIEIVRNPIENASRSLGDEPFFAEIEKGRKKVNVRSTPPKGRVVQTVDGGTLFLVTEVQNATDPIYLLKERISLVDEFSGNLVERAANSQLQIVADKGQSYLVDIEDDHGETVRILVPKSKVSVRYDSWFYSDNLKGWVFSGLCTVID